MWKIEKNLLGNSVVLCVSGRMQTDLIPELERLLAAEGDHTNYALDLANVRLADYEAVRFLGDCEARGIELQNCPPYIREWIDRGKASK
jgi:hypothetical protein